MSAQIDELTRGLQIPLSPIHPDIMCVLVDTVEQVFADLVSRKPLEMSSSDEAYVTALLEGALNKLLEDCSELFSQIVRSVSRGKESVNYNGVNIEKRPDLSFSLTHHSCRHPLIVEAKIIDAPKRKSIKLYCQEGVQRFINGDYAWACSEALMFAYVRDSSDIKTVLTPELSIDSSYNVVCVPTPVTGNLAISKHNRHFPIGTTSAGPIELWHLWLT